jgi:hypothetical protein
MSAASVTCSSAGQQHRGALYPLFDPPHTLESLYSLPYADPFAAASDIVGIWN